MREIYLAQVQNFLQKALTEEVEIKEEDIEKFGEACKKALRRQFINKKRKEFSLYASNIGKPYCQLWMEVNSVEGNSPDYSMKMKGIFGDLIEALALVIMKSAGLNINSDLKKGEVELEDNIKLRGIPDVEIDDKIWDIKSASPFSFINIFGDRGGFKKIADEDTFGYLTQGFLYEEMSSKPFAGWVVINKSTGEWEFVETPIESSKYKQQAIEKATVNYRKIRDKEPFARDFEDKPEYFNRKPTGNRILGTACGFCKFKQKCWPGVEYKASLNSKSKNPGWYWYTHIEGNDGKS